MIVTAAKPPVIVLPEHVHLPIQQQPPAYAHPADYDFSLTRVVLTDYISLTLIPCIAPARVVGLYCLEVPVWVSRPERTGGWMFYGYRCDHCDQIILVRDFEQPRDDKTAGNWFGQVLAPMLSHGCNETPRAWSPAEPAHR